jgi:eukaryotic-like serine/threonine-protein kinase
VLRAGDQLGKYQLEHLLGRGGMGEVWAAHDPDLDRRVAVKVLSGAVTNSAEGLARLQREGRAMARLRHANVITVHDAAFADGRGMIAMELIDGENLASWLTRAHPRAQIVDTLLDLRRTFVSLSLADGARKDILRWITHGPTGDIMDLYTTLPWPALCAEVRKLQVDLVEGKLLAIA